MSTFTAKKHVEAEQEYNPNLLNQFSQKDPEAEPLPKEFLIQKRHLNSLLPLPTAFLEKKQQQQQTERLN